MTKERRRSTRKEVLETFQVFLVIPKRGLRRLGIRDASDHGLAFVADASDRFQSGEILDSFFYVNPALRIPLKLAVRRIMGGDEPVIGTELELKDSPGANAYFSFLRLLDELRSYLDPCP